MTGCSVLGCLPIVYSYLLNDQLHFLSRRSHSGFLEERAGFIGTAVIFPFLWSFCFHKVTLCLSVFYESFSIRCGELSEVGIHIVPLHRVYSGPCVLINAIACNLKEIREKTFPLFSVGDRCLLSMVLGNLPTKTFKACHKFEGPEVITCQKYVRIPCTSFGCSPLVPNRSWHCLPSFLAYPCDDRCREIMR